MTRKKETNPTGIQVFNHVAFGNLRMMTDEKGQPFFVGKDVHWGIAILQMLCKYMWTKRTEPHT